MLTYTDLKPGTHIVLDGQPYRVMEYNFLKVQMRKPVTQTKLKNLFANKTVERTFQASEKIKEAEIKTNTVKYLYSNKGESWFCEENNPSARFKIDTGIIEEYIDLIKPNTLVDMIVFVDTENDDEEKAIGIKPPAKVELKVVEAPPSIKGNTAQGGTKKVKVETGAMIDTPLFVETGDVISVNTQTREYAERVTKGK